MGVSVANIMRLIVMILLAVAIGMALCYDNKTGHNGLYVVLAGGLVVYITFTVGLCTEEVDPELAQYVDIISIGPCFGLGLFWIVVHAQNNSHACALVMGIVTLAASVFMLIAALLSNK